MSQKWRMQQIWSKWTHICKSFLFKNICQKIQWTLHFQKMFSWFRLYRVKNSTLAISCDKSPKHFNDFIDYSLLPSFSNTLWFFWYHLIRLPAEDLSISISAKKKEKRKRLINLSSCSVVHACLPSMFLFQEKKTKKNKTVFAVFWSNSTWHGTESTGFWQFHPRSRQFSFGKQKTVNKHTKADVPDTQLAKFIASHQIFDVKLS